MIEQIQPNQEELTKYLESLTFIQLEQHIYKHYSQKQQAQDEKWTTAYTTKLKAAGVKDLEITVVNIIRNMNQQPIDEAIEAAVNNWGSDVINLLTGETEESRFQYGIDMLTKLVNVGIRTEWAESCIKLAKQSLVSGKSPKYQEYPL